MDKDDGLFLFLFTATPTPASGRADAIASAEVEVWVRGRELSAAQAVAEAYVTAQGWRIEVVQHAGGCTVPQLQRLEPEVAKAAATGFHQGIHMTVIAGARI